MGLQIGELVPRKEITLDHLQGKVIAVDSFNVIYQFLSNIRQPDGTPLMDNKGNVTSHLSGLFYRTINLMQRGIKPVFVFDGKSPDLKKKEKEEREARKKEAKIRYEMAKKEKKEDEMFKYSKQMMRLTDEMVEDSKKLLEYMGLPVVQAPSEGEAQCAFMAKKEDVYSTASQDYDALLFGSPRLLQNLTLARKRRLASGAFISIQPQMIELQKVLNSLQLSQEQLISLGILCGTDFNPGGIRGIGPKKALQLVRQYKQPVLIFRAMGNKLASAGQDINFDWQKIFEIFKKPEATTNYKIEFNKPKEDKIKDFLCKKHDFSENRIDNAVARLHEQREKRKQRDLKKWF
jgi:flap endonuclease-1